MSNLTVACVLRSGGVYDQDWVWALRRGLNKHLPTFDMAVLTNMGGMSTWAVPLEHAWPGWWSKMELFRPGLFRDRVLYLDLDTLVVGDLSEIASYEGEFAAVEDFYRKRGRLQSCVMAWEPGPATEALYADFVASPEEHIRHHRSDQDYIEAALSRYDLLTELYPDQIVSLKVHARPPKATGPPKGARLVCGHGKPRLSNPSAGWAHEAWLAA